MDSAQFQSQGGMAFALSAADGRVATELNGEHPPTQEAILAENASLKTRVSELEVIQELYRGRLQQLESEETNVNQLREVEAQLRGELEESHHRENMLKRRLDELELELKAARDNSEAVENGRHAKKPRVEEPSEQPSEQPSEPAEPVADPEQTTA
jgi:GATA-binding protein